MRVCSAQSVQSAFSDGCGYFEDAAAAISATNIEFLGLPSHSSQLGELLRYWVCFVGSKRRAGGSIVATRLSNALSGMAGAGRPHSTLGQGTCYRLAREMAESVHLLERTFDLLQRREFQ